MSQASRPKVYVTGQWLKIRGPFAEMCLTQSASSNEGRLPANINHPESESIIIGRKCLVKANAEHRQLSVTSSHGS